MKAKHIILVIAFCLVVSIAAILMKQHSSTVTTPSDASAGTASNSVPFVTNRTELAGAIGKTNITGDEDYFKKIVDPDAGQYAIIGLDKQTVTLKDKSGNVIWTVNLTSDIKGLGLPADWRISRGFFNTPSGGKPKCLVVADEDAYFELNVDSGKVTRREERHRIP